MNVKNIILAAASAVCGAILLSCAKSSLAGAHTATHDSSSRGFDPQTMNASGILKDGRWICLEISNKGDHPVSVDILRGVLKYQMGERVIEAVSRQIYKINTQGATIVKVDTLLPGEGRDYKLDLRSFVTKQGGLEISFDVEKGKFWYVVSVGGKDLIIEIHR